MGIFNRWPYTNFHEMNLDWIIEEVKKVVTEVEALDLSFDELKKYVEDYFKNLDISKEVNDKIDEMAASGELEQLILDALQLKALLSFNILSDLESAENLINGSNVRIMGKDAYSDGYGAFYHIRESRTTDIIDGDNIVSLNNYPSLIAEKLPDKSNEELDRENTISKLMPETASFMWGTTRSNVGTGQAHANGGIAYHDNTLYLAYMSSNDTTAVIERVTMDGVTKLATYTANMGHVNSITFNPVLNKLVVANVTNQLFLLDENLQSATVFDLTTIGIDAIGEVAYDPIRNVMIMGSYYLYIVNAEMTELITRITTPTEWDGHPQGLTVYDGLVIRNFNNVEKIRYEYIDPDYASITLLNSRHLPNIWDGVLLGELEDLELTFIDNKPVMFVTYSTLWDRTTYNSVWKWGIGEGTGQERGIIGNNNMYVDIAYTGFSDGTQEKPYKTLTEAISHSYLIGAKNNIYLLSDIESEKHNNFFDLKGNSITIYPQVDISNTIAISDAASLSIINTSLEMSNNLNLRNIDRVFVSLQRNTGIIQCLRVQGELDVPTTRLIANHSILVSQRNIITLEGTQGSIVTGASITTRTGFTRGLSVSGVQNL